MKSAHIIPLITISLLTILALTSLEKFPIFADEAIYLFWARKIMLGMSNPFISLYDGKPPLFMWVAGLSSLLSQGMLVAGRVVSVLAYTASLLLTYFFLGKKDRYWALVAIPLIACSPFIFFHARLAILDMLFTLFVIASVFAWTFVSNRYRGTLTGLCIGLAFWVKTPALFLLPFPVVSALLLDRTKNAYKQAGIAILTTLIAIGSLRISVWFPFLFNRAEDFSYPLAAVIKGQTGHITPNAISLFSWIVSYKMLPILIAMGVGLVFALMHRRKDVGNILIASICFTAPFIVLGKVLAPRYYLPAALLITIIAAFGISQLKRNIASVVTGTLVIAFTPFLFTLLTNHLKTPLPQVDKGQYLQNWASGIGIREASQFFLEQAKTQRVKVLSEGYFGTLPDGLFVEIGDKFNGLPLEIVGVGENGSQTYYKEVANSKADSIYYIGNHDRINQQNISDLELILSFPKVDNGPALEVYKILK